MTREIPGWPRPNLGPIFRQKKE